MKWSPAMVARYGRAGGFDGDSLAVAVAVALAASDGDDLYQWVVDPGPSYDARGLWAIDVVEHPDVADGDLYDPRTNARAAHTLYVDAGDTFAWSPVFRSGMWRRQLTRASEGVSVRDPRQTVGSATASAADDGAPLNVRRRLLDVIAYAQDRARERGV